MDPQTIERPKTVNGGHLVSLVPEPETDAGHGAQIGELSQDTAAEFTDAQAREWLATERAAGRRPSIRASAAAWNWQGAAGKSRAERLIAKITAEITAVAASAAIEASRAYDERRAEQDRLRDQELDARAETFDVKNPNLLVPEQPMTVVHWNMYDQVVILQRSEATNYEGEVEDDPFVVISRVHLPKLIARLTAMSRETS